MIYFSHIYFDFWSYLFNIFFDLKYQIGNYEKEIEEMRHMTRQEYVASLRRYIVHI